MDLLTGSSGTIEEPIRGYFDIFSSRPYVLGSADVLSELSNQSLPLGPFFPFLIGKNQTCFQQG